MYKFLFTLLSILLLFYGITTVFYTELALDKVIWFIAASLSFFILITIWIKIYPALNNQNEFNDSASDESLENEKIINQESLKIAEAIRKQEYVDKLTQLGNRSFFDARLDVMLLPNRFSGEGALALISLSVIEDIAGNENLSDTDKELISQAAILLENSLQDYPAAIISRVSNTDFAILFSPISKNQPQRIAKKIDQALSQLKAHDSEHKENCYHIGITRFTSGSSRFELMATADLALRSAQLKGTSGWHEIDSNSDKPAWGMVQWRTFFDNAIRKKNIRLYLQPVVDLETGDLIHNEVFSRLLDRFGKEIFANEFVPMASACGVLPKIDKMVVDKLIKWYLHQPKSNQRLCVNLSVESLSDETFIDWLIKSLSAKRELLSRFIIEFPERATLTPDGTIIKMVNKLNDAGIEVGIDHVGESLVEFDYLNWFPTSYLKIHQSIISNINDEQHQYQELLIQSLANVAESKNFLLLAEGIESEYQVKVLDELGISAGQGFYLGKPKAISFV